MVPSLFFQHLDIPYCLKKHAILFQTTNLSFFPLQCLFLQRRTFGKEEEHTLYIDKSFQVLIHDFFPHISLWFDNHSFMVLVPCPPFLNLAPDSILSDSGACSATAAMLSHDLPSQQSLVFYLLPQQMHL